MRKLSDWILRSVDGREFRLSLREGGSLSLGRDLTCDISLLDAGVSRHHATLSVESGELCIEDIHSQNGTFVNSERVGRRALRSGDVVTLGRIHLTIREEDEYEELDAAVEVSVRDTAIVQPSRFLPSQPRWSSDRHVDSADEAAAEATRERPTRLLTLLEGQLSRVRRRLVDDGRLDPASHDDLVELSLATRALAVLLGGETSSARRLDLSSTVRQVVDSSALVAEPNAIETEAPVEILAPPEHVSLAVELLLSSARRLEANIVIRVSESPESSTAIIRLEARTVANTGERNHWNDQDIALVLAQRLVETLEGATLRVEPEPGRFELELPLATAKSPSPHANFA